MPPSDWIDHHRTALDWIPFASMWLGTRADDRPRLTKTMEQFLMAVAAAALAIYVNDKLQDYKIEQLQASIHQVREEMKSLRDELRYHSRGADPIPKTDQPPYYTPRLGAKQS